MKKLTPSMEYTRKDLQSEKRSRPLMGPSCNSKRGASPVIVVEVCCFGNEDILSIKSHSIFFFQSKLDIFGMKVWR